MEELLKDLHKRIEEVRTAPFHLRMTRAEKLLGAEVLLLEQMVAKIRALEELVIEKS